MKIITTLILTILMVFPSVSETIRLKAGQSIREAVDKASAGDTLLLTAGIYQENEIIIRKPLTILGESYPIIDGQDKGNIFLVAGEKIHFIGIKIINTGKSSMNDSAGIKFFDSKNCSVDNVKLENTFFGLHFSNSSNMTITNNHLISTAEKEYHTGNGIHLWKCKNSLIENNYVKGHRDGIYLEFVTNTVSQGNLIEENNRYGLHFMFSHENSYIKNTFKKNGAGVAVMYTKNVLMKENIFEENEGPSSYGILLKDISDSEVVGNIFRKNTIGIYMEGSSRTLFKNNSFNNNGWALKLMASNDDNTFIANNFFANTFDISTNGNLVLNKLEENYWDKYEGYDLDKDKIGDIPYRPINLFSVIVEKIPSAVILWRSFMVSLLDRMEKVIPSITPENMIDKSPKMKPYDFGTTHP
ncbi:nitrous oxidase accessory protein [Aquiflexum balticum DSM 16537]|uniref:Nitrous oxidase accessory protein n=1 Tax=Aquiflexum balticum DSM 16537 TaxID=758820 RepID=A0A1W2HAX2_9BACT|nr:nitrous oxide reductase family maturation protein NosD [Aquiflexum balticum]SMD46040.1 nitrous oxidase accessory protein [Aquiflexum balticum DSM 16537]